MKALPIWIVCALLAAAEVVLGAAPAPADAETDHEALSRELRAGPASKELITRMIKLLQDDAERELAFEPMDEELPKRVEEMQFDEASVKELTVQLGRLPRTVPSGRAALALTQRAMETVKDEKALKDLSALAQRLNASYRYQPLPAIRTTTGNLPDKYPDGASIGALMKSLEAAQRQALQGELRSRAALLNNEVVRDMQQLDARLLLRTHAPGGDVKVARMIVDEERRNVATFSSLLGVVRDEAEGMEPAAARRMYRSLAGYADGIQLKKGNYYKPWEANYRANQKPEFQTANNVFPYIDFAKTLNVLAPIAGEPAVKEPSKKELDEAHKKAFGGKKKK